MACLAVGFLNRFNYLDKMSGITTLIEFPSGYVGKNIFDTVETHHPIVIPGVEGLMIPSGTCGHILKVLTPNIGLIRWEASCIFLLGLNEFISLLHWIIYPHAIYTLTVRDMLFFDKLLTMSSFQKFPLVIAHLFAFSNLQLGEREVLRYYPISIIILFCPPMEMCAYCELFNTSAHKFS